jgi:hypothetical protein
MMLVALCTCLLVCVAPCALMYCCCPLCVCTAASEYPLDSLDVPSAPEQERLTSWQETHARLMLARAQQLQDLRFVMCPK